MCPGAPGLVEYLDVLIHHQIDQIASCTFWGMVQRLATPSI